jgi:hypothetical protein
LLFASALALNLYFFPVANAQTPAIGVFNDALCLGSTESIQWGVCSVGSEVTRVVYVRNQDSKESVMGVEVAVEDFKPVDAAPLFVLSGDALTLPLPPGQVSMLPLTLKISPDVREVTDFSFCIVVSPAFTEPTGGGGGGGGGGSGAISTRQTPAETLIPTGNGQTINDKAFFQFMLIVAAGVGVFLLLGGGGRKR